MSEDLREELVCAMTAHAKTRAENVDRILPIIDAAIARAKFDAFDEGWDARTEWAGGMEGWENPYGGAALDVPAPTPAELLRLPCGFLGTAEQVAEHRATACHVELVRFGQRDDDVPVDTAEHEFEMPPIHWCRQPGREPCGHLLDPADKSSHCRELRDAPVHRPAAPAPAPPWSPPSAAELAFDEYGGDWRG